MPRRKKRYMPPVLPPQPVAPAPPKPERISYAGIEEASAASGISVDELSKAIKSGALPAETSRRPFLILRADLELYIRRQGSFCEAEGRVVAAYLRVTVLLSSSRFPLRYGNRNMRTKKKNRCFTDPPDQPCKISVLNFILLHVCAAQVNPAIPSNGHDNVFIGILRVARIGGSFHAVLPSS